MTYKPTKWWRVMRNGKLWAETSSEHDARSRMESGDVLERLYIQENYDWQHVVTKPEKPTQMKN